MKYTITGVDETGRFEEVRRYNEFNTLRAVLIQRWPGIYVPAIPEKKAVGNMDEKFIEERRALLERFLKELSKSDYLINSKEFRIFAKEKGEVDKYLNSLQRQTPIDILDKYRMIFEGIDEDQDNSKIATYKENIKEFQYFISRALTIMGG